MNMRQRKKRLYRATAWHVRVREWLGWRKPRPQWYIELEERAVKDLIEIVEEEILQQLQSKG